MGTAATVTGMASIEQRQGKPRDGKPGPISYRVHWRNPARGGKTESSTYGTEAHAGRAKKLAEAHGGRITKQEVEAVILGTPIDETKPKAGTVAAWAQTWLESRTSLSDGQIGRYEQQLRDRILPAIGALQLDEVGGTDVAKLIHALRKDLSETTVTRYYSCVHALFAAAVLEKKIGDNPAKRTDFIRTVVAKKKVGADDEEHVYLTPQQYDRIRSNLPPSAHPLTDFLMHTGARWSEATAAGPEQVDVKGRRILIDRAWKRLRNGKWEIGEPKSGKSRWVPVGQGLLADIAPIAKERAGQKLLFVTPVNTSRKGGRRGGGNRWMHSNYLNRYWDVAVGAAMRCDEHPPPLPEKQKTGPRRKWLPSEVSTCDCPDRLKVRPTPHDLRHSYVSWLLAAGRPLASISRRLGHFSVTLTETTYAGLLPEVDEADGAVIDAALKGLR